MCADFPFTHMLIRFAYVFVCSVYLYSDLCAFLFILEFSFLFIFCFSTSFLAVSHVYRSVSYDQENFIMHAGSYLSENLIVFPRLHLSV